MPLNLPNYSIDELYRPSQQAVYDMSKGLVSGNVPSYYAPIGEYGGTVFENMLSGVRSDKAKSVTENLARTNITGVRETDLVARTMGKITPQLRYEDMLRGIEGRKGLLTTGMAGLESTGRSALDLSSSINQYELSKAGLGLQERGLDIGEEQFAQQFGLSQEELALRRELGLGELDVSKQRLGLEQSQFEYKKKAAKSAQKQQLWSDIISTVVSAGTGMVGANIMGSAIKTAGQAAAYGSRTAPTIQP